MSTTTHGRLIIDSDVHFTVDAITRNITNDYAKKNTILQGDHNSERFTFKVPRYLEGHDMLACDNVRVAYINAQTDGRDKKHGTGVYLVSDLALDPTNSNFVTCSWLISKNATMYEGVLNFMLIFSCMDGELVKYRWKTNVFESIYVAHSLDADMVFEAEYLDVIEQWKMSVKNEFSTYLEASAKSHYDEFKNVLHEEMEAEFDAMQDNLDDTLRTELGSFDNDINVLKSRMDTFASLPSGSTSGNAEIRDIRVGADGTTYATAGEAVRSQVSGRVSKTGTDEITPENANFIIKHAPSAQMLDISSFEGDKSLATAFGVATPYDLNDANGLSVSNVIDCPDVTKRRIAINASKSVVVLGYSEQNGRYTRFDFFGGSTMDVVGDHYEFTISPSIRKLRVQVTSTDISDKLLMTYADEWKDSEKEYRPNVTYSLSPNISILGNTAASAEPFEGKVFYGVGDSIMQGAGEASGGFLGILSELYPSINVVNLGVGSTTIAVNDKVPANNSEKCILDRIDDIQDDADYIILEGGLNDFFHSATYDIPFGNYEDNLYKMPLSANYIPGTGYTDSINLLQGYGDGTSAYLDPATFCGAFEMCLIKLVTRFYKNKFGVVIPHNPRGTKDIDDYMDAEVRLCEKYGVPCLDLRKVAAMPRVFKVAGGSDGVSALTIDAVHPNRDGYTTRYIPPFVAWLRTL